jgi:DNA-binding CsgD family transcriptional regulator
MLWGREDQTVAVTDALDRACEGRAEILRLVGGPGLGKTTLLDLAVDLAGLRGMHVVRLVALEIEQELPGAGLDVLLRQLGSPGTPATPAALLAALGAASTDTPLLLTIDDIQWLDQATLAAVSFATRRLLADPVAVMLAGRPETDRIAALQSIPRVEVPPLTVTQAAAMLREISPSMPRSTAEAVADAFGGVPLALRDIDRLLPAEVLSGLAPLPAPLPVSTAVQDRYARGFEDLEPETRLAVVTMACETVGDPDVIRGALEHLGIDTLSLEPAEDAGLIRLHPAPAFVHPLARAAVHSATRPREVRRAHEALGRALMDRGDREGSLRHRAACTRAPDPDLADELRIMAERLSRAPGARVEAGAVALVAARFADTPQARDALLLMAARCSDADRALAIVRDLERNPLSPDLAAACTFLRLEHDVRVDPQGGLTLLSKLEHEALSAHVSSEAEVWRVWQAADALDLAALREVATRIELTNDDVQDWVLLAAGGIAFSFIGENARAATLLRRACDLSAEVDPSSLTANQLTDWAVLPGWLGEDDREHAARFRTMNHLLRETGQPEKVVPAAFFSAERARREGAWGRAEALFREAMEVSASCGIPDHASMARLACLLAYRGDPETMGLLDSCREGLRAWSPWMAHWIEAAEGAFALTTGRPSHAVAVLSPLRDLPFVGRGARDAIASGLVDLIEGLVLLEDGEAARAATEDLARRLDGVVDPFGPAMVARSRALVNDGNADTHFADALAHLGRTTEVFETARTHLLLGQHLRRTRRPRDSRDSLARALAVFEQLRAPHWAERARRELAASGERTSPRPERGGARESLTPQEARVALAASDGLTNAEIATALFLSVKTVEFHLGRVYRKLGVRSRGGLARAMAAQGL